jgi:hypothetical protein
MTRINPLHQEQRVDFVLNRLKRGFSILETQRLFAKEYHCAPNTARRWVNIALNQATLGQSPQDRQDAYTIALAMAHDHARSYNSDLDTINARIKRLKQADDRRTEIMMLLPTVSHSTAEALQNELERLPIDSISVMLKLISAKNSILSGQRRAMKHLAQLQGVIGPGSNWCNALFTLLDSGLISPNVAESILTKINDFEQKTRTVGEVRTEPVEPEDIEALLDESSM